MLSCPDFHVGEVCLFLSLKSFKNYLACYSYKISPLQFPFLPPHFTLSSFSPMLLQQYSPLITEVQQSAVLVYHGIVGIVVLWGKPLRAKPASHFGVPMGVALLLSLIQLPTNSSQKTRWPKCLGLCYAHGRARWNSEVLASACPSLSCCSHLENESVVARPLSLSFCYSGFQIKKKQCLKNVHFI